MRQVIEESEDQFVGCEKGRCYLCLLTEELQWKLDLSDKMYKLFVTQIEMPRFFIFFFSILHGIINSTFLKQDEEHSDLIDCQLIIFL